MKFLVHILTIMILGVAVNTGTASHHLRTDGAWIESSEIQTNHAVLRVLEFHKDLYIAFQGAPHKIGDFVTIKVFTGKGQLVLNENAMAYGNGQLEVFSIEELGPGVYTAVISGQIYNLEQDFVLQ